MSTRVAAKRTAQRAAPTKTKRPTADPICDELDRLDLDDEVFYLGNGHAPAMKAIKDLDEAQRLRTHEMIAVQRVYLQLLEDLKDPTDQSGRNFDTQAVPSLILAIGWTMALLGYRRVADAKIKRRGRVWVDVRQPDDPVEALLDTDKASDKALPPDVRGLAAQRDGEEPRVLAEWHVSVEPKIVDAPRPKDWE